MAAGDLDTSFAGNGKKRINFGGTDEARAVLVQPNGRIVVAGGGAAAQRLLRRAPAQPTARSTPRSGRAGSARSASAATTSPRSARRCSRTARSCSSGDSDFRVAVARLNPNGSLDTTFSGDGKAALQLGRDQPRHGRARAAERQAPGRRLLGARGRERPGRAAEPRTARSTRTFGTGGKAAVDFGGDDFGLAMARQANGRILVAGRSTTAGAVVARLRANGALDPDFGGDGRVTLPGGGSLERGAGAAGPQDRRRRQRGRQPR